MKKKKRPKQNEKQAGFAQTERQKACLTHLTHKHTHTHTEQEGKKAQRKDKNQSTKDNNNKRTGSYIYIYIYMYVYMYIYVCIYVYDRSFLLNSDRQKNLDKRLARVEKKNTHTHTLYKQDIQLRHIHKKEYQQKRTQTHKHARRNELNLVGYLHAQKTHKNTQAHHCAGCGSVCVCVCVREKDN